MKKNALILTVLFFLCTFLAGGVTNAAVISFMDNVPMQTTNWDEMVSINKFNPNWGTLNSIKFTLDGGVEGSAKYESMDASPAIITLNLEASIELQRPDNTLLVQVFPIAFVTENADAFDGLVDFDGPSGSTFGNLTASASDFLISGEASDLALFTGIGSIELPFKAFGTSTGSGAGNLITQFNTSAEGNVTVMYDYDAVPIPAGFLLFGSGLVGLLGLKRKLIG